MFDMDTRARDERLNREVALKRIHSRVVDEHARQRFRLTKSSHLDYPFLNGSERGSARRRPFIDRRNGGRATATHPQQPGHIRVLTR